MRHGTFNSASYPFVNIVIINFIYVKCDLVLTQEEWSIISFRGLVALEIGACLMERPFAGRVQVQSEILLDSVENPFDLCDIRHMAF